jgi:hypothetical protein
VALVVFGFVAAAALPVIDHFIGGTRTLSEAVIGSAIAVAVLPLVTVFLPQYRLVFWFPFVAWAAGLNLWLTLGFFALGAIVKTLALLDKRDAEMAEKANTKRIEEASNND